MPEILVAAISAVAMIVVAVINGIMLKDRKRAERRSERRATESRLSMELMSATCALSIVTAKKVTDQQINGDVKKAIQAAYDAQESYAHFLNETAAYQVTKV